MRINLIQTGKTSERFIKEGVEMFRKRIVHYVPFGIETVQDLKKRKSMTMKEVQDAEGILLLKRIREGDHVILLDERGEEYTSISFAEHLNGLQGRVNRLLFIIGGAYGFSEELYRRADSMMSLSRLTFSHQLARLIFVEQLYRAFTILKGEPYHHQ